MTGQKLGTSLSFDDANLQGDCQRLAETQCFWLSDLSSPSIFAVCSNVLLVGLISSFTIEMRPDGGLEEHGLPFEDFLESL